MAKDIFSGEVNQKDWGMPSSRSSGAEEDQIVQKVREKVRRGEKPSAIDLQNIRLLARDGHPIAKQMEATWQAQEGAKDNKELVSSLPYYAGILGAITVGCKVFTKQWPWEALKNEQGRY